MDRRRFFPRSRIQYGLDTVPPLDLPAPGVVLAALPTSESIGAIGAIATGERVRAPDKTLWPARRFAETAFPA